MIRWGDEVLGTIDAALAAAVAGTPTVLVITGVPGLGKSTLLDTIGGRATGFEWLATEAFETSASQPFDVLSGLGIDVSGGPNGEQLTPLIAAQRLRARVDEAASGGGVLVTIDDLQWADGESVAALLALVSRASGDRLLVCTGSRPLEPGQHEAWRRWTDRPGRVKRIELTGLSEATAVEIARELRPSITTQVATRLWKHTSGNPLYLARLVTEYDDSELAQMRELPAPAEYAQRVGEQIARLPPAGQKLATGLAVLGGGWWALRDAAAAAELKAPAPALKSLLSTGLVETRAAAAGDQLRFSHSLIRAAIYQGLSSEQRQRAHSRAASVVTGVGAALEHRVAAVEIHDDALAAEIEAHSLLLYRQRSYRLSAHFRDLAGAVSSDSDDRERHWLESLVARIISGDRFPAASHVEAIQQARPTPLRDLTLAVLLNWERRVQDALAILDPRSRAEVVPAEQAWVQHRIEALLAWLRLNAGRPEAAIDQALNRAASYDEFDPMFSRLAMLARAQVIARHVTSPDQLPGVADLPDSPSAVPVQQTALLGWRGLVRSHTGQFAEAIADLTEMTDRMQRGLADFSSGAYHAMLARAQWYAGDWAMSRVNFRLAAEVAGDRPPPLVVVSAALPALGAGDLRAADEALAIAHSAIDGAPWVEAVDQVLIVDVLRQHSVGVADPSIHPSIKDSIATIRRGEIFKNVMWCLHAGLASVWARAMDDVMTCADRVASADARTDWAASGAAWLRGLALEAAGDGKGALAQLRAATATTSRSTPLYVAHFHVDHARVAHLMNDPAGAARSLEVAASAYQQLAAASYLKQVDDIRRTSESIKAAALGLSERERDVLALVTSGMSYSQIARDLFITQSTVSYHLGNIYAKANVSSRHQLTQLAREEPSIFGLPALG